MKGGDLELTEHAAGSAADGGVSIPDKFSLFKPLAGSLAALSFYFFWAVQLVFAYSVMFQLVCFFQVICLVSVLCLFPADQHV